MMKNNGNTLNKCINTGEVQNPLKNTKNEQESLLGNKKVSSKRSTIKSKTAFDESRNSNQIKIMSVKKSNLFTPTKSCSSIARDSRVKVPNPRYSRTKMTFYTTLHLVTGFYFGAQLALMTNLGRPMIRDSLKMTNDDDIESL